ncbi:unknown; predicted coding region [Mycoplasmopsis pulmonis]|uniref:Uncharacterized protein n=1 Tax=Mycoplasmopsis pulmonis (strain UAB CTIP) TaxID=272635 RepID=Q98QI0_MYCPU|nr:hypothetical protein [Mycoplasmopsis pulmonis]MDZ7293335.1 hypothetical protein [Mycoplasmopsis pulmonis]CAC13554.1 unknown; predicted coding region [Mycoplasmopsis pulmonis]VEU68143.1 Uncharacterised protein [Mycoplasmopsis pulmonis]
MQLPILKPLKIQNENIFKNFLGEKRDEKDFIVLTFDENDYYFLICKNTNENLANNYYFLDQIENNNLFADTSFIYKIEKRFLNENVDHEEVKNNKFIKVEKRKEILSLIKSNLESENNKPMIINLIKKPNESQSHN